MVAAVLDTCIDKLSDVSYGNGIVLPRSGNFIHPDSVHLHSCVLARHSSLQPLHRRLGLNGLGANHVGNFKIDGDVLGLRIG